MKIAMKNIDVKDVVLGLSVNGYGLCLLEMVESDLEHGCEFLNLFTKDLEFHHLSNDSYFWVDNSLDIEALLAIYKGE